MKLFIPLLKKNILPDNAEKVGQLQCTADGQEEVSHPTPPHFAAPLEELCGLPFCKIYNNYLKQI